ncbi:MAG: ABC transporter ATP-binding protein [Actinomycetota bacterium]
MIQFLETSVRYDGAREPVFAPVSFSLQPGALHLVIGPTGAGKTTLLGLLNGHVPHFTGGRVDGDVRVSGRSIRDFRPRDFADLVGVVRQNPRAGFVADTVEHEIAYAMENLGFSRVAMHERVDHLLEQLELGGLRNRKLPTLSGGQAQRVAIAAALSASPSVLVLDEPTSGLDPEAAASVVGILEELVAHHGVTVVVSEHRLERIIGSASSVVVVDGGMIRHAPPSQAMTEASVVPPIVELGRALDWSPLPLTVAMGRQFIEEIEGKLASLHPSPRRLSAEAPIAVVEGGTVSFGASDALSNIDVEVRPREVTALVGHNGAGKSTLLGLLCGLVSASSGRVRVGGEDPLDLDPHSLVRRVGLIPQDPGLLLYSSSVERELQEADSDGGLEPGTCAAWFSQFQPDVEGSRHPRDLSEGQRLCLALAIVMASSPPLLLLDEPTCGLDNHAKEHLGIVLGQLAERGTAIVLASHDVEFIATVSDRVIELDKGVLVSSWPARSRPTSRMTFTSQMQELLGSAEWLTAKEVIDAVRGTP